LHYPFADLPVFSSAYASEKKFIIYVQQSRVIPYVAGNWADMSVAKFTPVGRWLHYSRPTANSENG